MWEQQFVETERGRFEVFVFGNGEPLCVTHLYSEFNERGNYFADRFVTNFKVYLINLKEAGNSPKVVDQEELSMEAAVEDLETIRRAIGLEKWSFAGHSTGGMLGLVYGANHPTALTKLLVGGATASNKYMAHKDSIYSGKNSNNARLKEIFVILKASESTREERLKAGREWTEMSLFDPTRYDDYFSKPSSGKTVQKRLEYYSYHDLPNYDIRHQLGKITARTVVYCGRHDSQCPIPFSKEIHELVPGSAFYIFEKSNHTPYLEEKEKFDDMIYAFKKLV